MLSSYKLNNKQFRFACIARVLTCNILTTSVLLTTSVWITSAAQATEVVFFQPAPTHHIRTLAASCAACHGTNGNPINVKNFTAVPILAGLDAQYFVTQMLAFRSGERSATVMHHHAKGLTTDEINLLALYFSQQKRIAGISPKPQLLKADHE